MIKNCPESVSDPIKPAAGDNLHRTKEIFFIVFYKIEFKLVISAELFCSTRSNNCCFQQGHYLTIV